MNGRAQVATSCFTASVTAETSCPCHSGAPYAQCCQPYHEGLPAPTALALMRSRYSAYAKHNIDYIMNTTHPRTRDPSSREGAKAWAVQSQWLGLTILDTHAGATDDTEGVVEFVARFASGGQVKEHHERSLFCKHEDRWHYLQAEPADKASPIRQAAKPGRNTTCPCGSGKKYKRCHGA